MKQLVRFLVELQSLTWKRKRFIVLHSALKNVAFVAFNFKKAYWKKISCCLIYVVHASPFFGRSINVKKLRFWQACQALFDKMFENLLLKHFLHVTLECGEQWEVFIDGTKSYFSKNCTFSIFISYVMSSSRLVSEYMAGKGLLCYIWNLLKDRDKKKFFKISTPFRRYTPKT